MESEILEPSALNVMSLSNPSPQDSVIYEEGQVERLQEAEAVEIGSSRHDGTNTHKNSQDCGSMHRFKIQALEGN